MGILHRALQLKKKWKMRRFYKAFIPAGGLCFDIGANHGKYTALFLRCNAKVVAVEPQKACFEELQKNYESAENVMLIHAAVGAEKGEAVLFSGKNDEVSTLSQEFIDAYSIYEHNKWEKQERIVLITLDDLVKEYGIPDFCKLDIEGWEEEALKGLSPAIPAISFEYNALLKQKAIACTRILAQKGNYVFNFSAYENCEFDVQWMSEEEMVCFIEKLPGTMLHGDIFAGSSAYFRK